MMQQYGYDLSEYTLILQSSPQVVFHTIETFQSLPKTS